MLRAQQDLGVARAQVTLQELRKEEAQPQIDLADLQWQRVDFIVGHYDTLLETGWTDAENLAFGLLIGAALYQVGGAILGTIAGTIAGTVASGGNAGQLGAILGAVAGGGAGLGQALGTVPRQLLCMQALDN